MKKQKISPFQLFTLMFLFELGTTVVVGIGLTAKQDAWWIILLSTGPGMLLFLIYSSLYRQNENLPLTTYIPRVLGRYIGYPMSVLYILFFMYEAARDVRDLIELLIISIIPETSMWIIGVVIVLLITYAVYWGIEPLARAGEIFFFVIVILGTIGALFIFVSDVIKLKHFLPLFQIKWKTIVTNILPETVNLPFGEAVTFTMLFPYLNQSNMVRKAGGSAIVLAGIVLSFTVALEIAALGSYIASTSVFPLLTLTQKINVLNFLQRLDAIAISVLIICVFFKITVFFYAAIIGITNMFKIKKRIYPIGLVGIIILIASILMASNTIQHLDTGTKILPVYLFIPLQIVFPLFLLAVTWIRKKLNVK
ncbi:GerAB/ArcD/ProY family transporter [Ectobacillus funiculus]|uniref:GerAB/ArcD/ProY family transporter n=1 Tax=Ectobacillus funiculus TaxID=137993 RepID=UPI00101E0DE1|nr:GerAB/ArcD/ProY family transporter [Ectobacillus funiculus]